MSKKHKLHNQLEDFFDELELETGDPENSPYESASEPANSEHAALPASPTGWTWECDSSGIITACSPEIENLLGYSPQQAHGQTLVDFALAPGSASRIKQALQSPQVDHEIEVVYTTSTGRKLHGRLNILSLDFSDGGNGRRARQTTIKGFTQILASQPLSSKPSNHKDRRPPQPAIPSTAEHPSLKDDSQPETDSPAAALKAYSQPMPDPVSIQPTLESIPATEEAQDQPQDEQTVSDTGTLPAYIPPEAGSGVLDRLQLNQAPKLEGKGEPDTGKPPAPQAAPENSYPDPELRVESRAGQKFQAPIHIQNQSLGVLELFDDDPSRVWSEEEQRLINDVVDQLSLALENAELFQQTQEALDETERLYQISADFNAAGSLEDILKSIGIANEADQRPFAVALWIFEPGEAGQPEWMVFSNLWIQSGRVLRTHLGSRLELAEYPGSATLFANPFEPLLFADLNSDPIDPSTRQLVEQNGGAAVVFLPLSLRGQWIGQISILWDTVTVFSARDQHRYRSLAAQAAVAVNNRLLFEQSEQRTRQLEWLSQIKDNLSKSIDETGILSAISMTLNQSQPPSWINLLFIHTDAHGAITGAETAAFWQDGMIRTDQPDFDSDRYLAVYQALDLFNALPEGIRFISDITHHTYSTPELNELAQNSGFKSICLMPLFSSGRWQGAITFVWRGVYELTSSEAFYLRELLEPLAAFVASRRSYLAEQEARQSMERRNLQLQTAAQVSRAASSVLDPDVLVRDTVEIVQSRFDLYYVGLFLIDENGNWTGEPNKWAVLRAGTGEAGQQMLEQGHRLAVNGASMIGTCIGSQKAQIWRGSEQDINRYRNPVLPETRSEMALPLISRGNVIGAMTFQSMRAGDFSDADIAVLQTMADQVANAIQNARLYARTEAALSETSTLYAIATAASRTLELREMLAKVLEQTLATTHFDAGVISVFNQDTDRLDLMAHNQIPERFLNKLLDQGLENSLCALVFERGEMISVQNMVEDAPMDVTGLVELGLLSYLGVPLRSKGRVLGTICLFGRAPMASMEADHILMEAIAQQAGIAVENANLFTQTQVALTETEVLYKASAELNTAQSYEDVLETLAKYTIFGKNAQHITINMFDRPWETVEPEWIHVLVRRSALPAAATSSRYAISDFPSIREILRPDAPSILENLEAEESLDGNARQLYLQQWGAKSAIFVPIVVAGQWIGFFNANYQQPTRFEIKDIRRLNALVNQSAVAIQNLQSVEITRQQANDATLLFESSQDLVQARSETEIYRAAIRACRQLEPIDFMAVYRFKEVTGERYMEQIVHSKLPEFPAAENYTLYPTDLYPYTRIVTSGESLYSDSIQEDERFAASEKELLARLALSSMAVLPIRLRSDVNGILMVAYERPHTFTIREKRFLETIIVQLNVALENYHLLQETERRARQLQTAAEVSRTTNSILETDELLQQVVNLVQERFELYYAGLFLVDEPEEADPHAARWAVLRAGTGIAGLQMKAQGHKLAIDENSMIGRCVLHGAASVSLNVSLEPGHYKNPLLPKTASEMALPLIALGETIGAMSIQSEQESAFTEDDIATLQTMADQVAIAIQNARLFGRTQEALSETESLYRASAELNTAQSHMDILQVLIEHSPVFRDFKGLNLYFFDHPWSDNHKPGNFQAAACLPEGQAVQSLPPTQLKNILQAEEFFRQSTPITINNAAGDLNPSRAALARLKTEAESSLMILPLVVAGQTIGFLETKFESQRQISHEALKGLTALVSQAAVAFQNLHSLELAEQRASEAQVRSQELELLNRVVSNVNAHTDLKSALTEIAHELGHALQVQVGIALMNASRSGLVIMAEHFLEATDNSAIGITIPIANNVSTQKVLETRRPLVVENAASNPMTSQLHQELAERHVETLNILPMLVGSEVIGTVGLDILEKGRTLSAEEMRLAESIILQAATAIQNVRLFEQTQEALTESEALYQANSELNTAQSYAAVLDILRRHTILGRGVSTVTINLFDQPWLVERMPAWYIPIAGWSARSEYQLNSRQPLAAWAMAEQLLQPNFPTFIADLKNDPRLDETTRRIAVNQPEAQGVLFAPLNATGRWIGHLAAVYQQALDFSEAELRRLTTLVGQAAVVIQNIRNAELTRQRAAQLEKLAGVQSALSQAGDEAEILSALVLPTRPQQPPVSIKLWYLHLNEMEAPVTAELVAAWGNGSVQNLPNVKQMRVAQDPLSKLWLNQPDKTLFVPSIEKDKRLSSAARKEIRARGEKSLVIIPLRSGGSWQGLVVYSWDYEQEFSEDDHFLLGRILEPTSEVVARRRAFIAQRQTAERLLEVDKLKTQFLANMSHELRTPLNSIIGFSRLILKGIDGPTTELQQQDLGAIYNSGQHLLSLINDILDLSKIEAGKMELTIEEVDLADLINSVMSTAVGLTKEKPIELDREIQTDLPIVYADRTRVRQVLINLLSNAAKFTEQGFIRIHARSQVNKQGQSEVWVGVSDSGPGISSEDQVKLFKAFSQVDASPTRKSGGTGLGLSISRHLIEMHGGEIGVESQIGQGSTFYFTLPLPQTIENTINLPENGRPVILAIDDNRQVISLYERYLSSHNYHIVPVTEPQKALELARQLHPFAITLDIMMPDNDGWSLLEQLKQDPETRHIPVIICSIQEDQEKGFSLGAVDYLVKPILEDDLIQAIQRLDRDAAIQRVLVVDDDPDDLRLVQKILEQRGSYSVDTALGGQQALVKLEEQPPSAIILDLYMPGLDGFSLLETVQSNPQTRGIPVIIFTGGDLDKAQRRLLTNAGQAILQKSLFTEEELLETLEHSLRRVAAQPAILPGQDS